VRAAFRRFKTNKTTHVIASSPDSNEKITKALSAPKIGLSIYATALLALRYDSQRATKSAPSQSRSVTAAGQGATLE
jgi:hypothetical protein